MVGDEKSQQTSGGDPVEDQSEETEDTLSLCDLPIYGDFGCDDWSDDSISKGSRASDPDEDYFEFSSREFHSQSSFQSLSESVVFCGRVIPYKKPILITERPRKPRKQRGRLSKWMSLLLRWGISSNNRSCVHKYGSLQNSRWYLFVFGVGRFPVEMELRDIKTRQSRLKEKTPMPPTSIISANWTIEKKSRTHPESGGRKPSSFGCLPLL
ncbi:hypothetical protein SAY86_027591 [Trapa natans]|uniref:Uncharacterized protein n=1 Tax=Trapa natans TaxID=22666 RepID=A0AAN7QJI2_TRANT|nr:hypothetical protein SAY86_027591 [Trapa natans]